MANINAGSVGTYGNTLVASTVDTVTFTTDALAVEVYSSGSAAIYVTVDGSTPTVGGGGTFELPAVSCVRTIRLANPGVPVVRLVSSGTPTYSVNVSV